MILVFPTSWPTRATVDEIAVLARALRAESKGAITHSEAIQLARLQVQR